MQAPLLVTKAAQDQIFKLCLEKQGKGLYIDITQTGCSGYAYKLDIISALPDTQDIIIYPQDNHLFVAIHKKNIFYIEGSILDYVREGLNKKFKFINPNEEASCGCGESFTIKQKIQNIETDKNEANEIKSDLKNQQEEKRD